MGYDMMDDRAPLLVLGFPDLNFLVVSYGKKVSRVKVKEERRKRNEVHTSTESSHSVTHYKHA